MNGGEKVLDRVLNFRAEEEGEGIQKQIDEWIAIDDKKNGTHGGQVIDI
jgi:chaperone required for assembly of F1-ATPase